ncbi:MAG: DNA polymerase III subunit gamma/tau C-terminal domain-containing protein, partial [Porticoccaceae bacterium]
QICLLGRKDLPLAPDLKSGFEMVLLRALAFRPDANPTSRRDSPVSAPEEAEPPAKKSEATAADLGANIAAPEPIASESAQQRPISLVQGSDSATAMAIQPPLESKQPAIKKIALEEFSPKNWIEIRKQLNIGASLGEIASHCLFQGRQDNQLRFLIDSDETSLYDTAHQQSLAVALSEYFDEQLSVEIIFGVAEQETPRAADIREKSERLAIAVETLNSDPSVVKFKQLFDGELDEKSVRPID